MKRKLILASLVFFGGLLAIQDFYCLLSAFREPRTEWKIILLAVSGLYTMLVYSAYRAFWYWVKKSN